jgi:rhamnogalacturonyl hydrolase YesR
LVKNEINEIKYWITDSGIQNNLGGFNSWFNLDTCEYPYVYSEITGYGITTLLYLYSLEEDIKLINKARLAADWIIKRALDESYGVLTRLYLQKDKEVDLYGFAQRNIFSFDTAMVLYALVNLSRVTEDKSYLDVGKKIADFLIEKMQKEDGSFAAIYNVTQDQILDSHEKWSSQSGSFHAKIALSFTDLYQETKDKKYKQVAMDVCQNALRSQDATGRFITNQRDQTTNIHPHCYSAEGLWYVGSRFQNEEFLDASRRATQWAYNHVSENGLNELYNPETKSFNDFQRCDVLAQVLRLGQIFGLEDKKEILTQKLLDHRYIGNNQTQQGGLLFSKQGSDVNAWTTMFALQALVWANEDQQNIKPELFI